MVHSAIVDADLFPLEATNAIRFMDLSVNVLVKTVSGSPRSGKIIVLYFL